MHNNLNLPSGPSTTLRDCLILVALTLACLLPFVGKAFNIDDPMYLWAAEHILRPAGPGGVIFVLFFILPLMF